MQPDVSIYNLSLFESSIWVYTEWWDSIGNEVLLSAFEVPHEAEEGGNNYYEGRDGEGPCWGETNGLAVEFVANVRVAHTIFSAETSSNFARGLTLVFSEIAVAKQSILHSITAEATIDSSFISWAVPVWVDSTIHWVASSWQLTKVFILNISSPTCRVAQIIICSYSAIAVEVAESSEVLPLDGLTLSVIAELWSTVAVCLAIAIVWEVTYWLVNWAWRLASSTCSSSTTCAVVRCAVIVLCACLSHCPVLIPPMDTISKSSRWVFVQDLSWDRQSKC